MRASLTGISGAAAALIAVPATGQNETHNNGTSSAGFSQTEPYPAGTVGKRLQTTLVLGDLPYGPVHADGVTDDSAAFNSIARAAALLSHVLAGQNVIIIVPPGKYRIASPIIQPGNVGWIGYGATLIGPITGYPRINSTTDVPAPTDVVAQCGGACFTDKGGKGTLYYARWEGLDFNGFRWAFVSQCYAWYEPQIVNCNFANCDGMALAYQGAQSWNFVDPILNHCHVGFVGAATCFAAGNPFERMDNFFADNIKISGRRSNPYLLANAAFDSWFQRAILRPTTASIVVSGNQGSYALAGIASAISPSSRLIYIPSRNNRQIFNTGIKDIILTGSARGCAFIARPFALDIQTVQGEGCFIDPVINATGSTETMITLTDHNSQITGVIANVDAQFSSFGGVCGGVLNVLRITGVQGSLTSSGNSGTIMTPHHCVTNLSNNVNSKEYNAWLSSIRGLDLPTKGVSSYSSIGSYYVYFTSGATHRLKEDAFGATMPKSFCAGKLPGPAGTETNAQIVWTGSIDPDLSSYPIQGSLRVWCRRMDTGVQDFYEALCTFGGRNSGTTLAGNVASGINVIPVTVATIGLGPGAVIQINGADDYVVKSISGLKLTLCTNTRNAYSSGTTIVPVFTMDRVITAFANGICSVAASPSQSAIQITSSLGTGVPVEWRAEFTSHGPPI